MSNRQPAGSLRQRQLDEVRDRLLDATLQVIESGQEPTMRAVASAAGVSERTVYRYFESRGALYAALQPKFIGRSGIPLCDSADDIEEYVSELFTTFERNGALVRALTNSPWAAPYLKGTRARNLKALRALLDAKFPRAPREDRAAAAASLRVPLSGAGWVYFRDAGSSNDEAISHAQWLVRTVKAELQRRSRQGHK